MMKFCQISLVTAFFFLIASHSFLHAGTAEIELLIAEGKMLKEKKDFSGAQGKFDKARITAINKLSAGDYSVENAGYKNSEEYYQQLKDLTFSSGECALLAGNFKAAIETFDYLKTTNRDDARLRYRIFEAFWDILQKGDESSKSLTEALGGKTKIESLIEECVPTANQGKFKKWLKGSKTKKKSSR